MARIGDRRFGGVLDRMKAAVGRTTGRRSNCVGLHIEDTRVRVVRMDRRNGRWHIRRWASIPMPPGTLRYAYKRSTVSDSEALSNAIREALGKIGRSPQRIGLAIPNEVVKVMMQPFKELPSSRVDVLKMIQWWANKSLGIPSQKALAAYQMVGNTPKGEKLLLIAIGYRDVIREYEVHVKALGVEPVVVRPAALHQLNFYAGELPDQGVCGFLGIFKNYFAITAMQDGLPFFHQGMKVAPTDENFVYHVDAALQYQQELHPGREIGKLFMNYPGSCFWRHEKALLEILPARPVMIDENRIVGTGVARTENQLTSYGGEMGTTKALSAFATAAGAAMGLVR